VCKVQQLLETVLMSIYFVLWLEMGVWINHGNRDVASVDTCEKVSLKLVSPCLSPSHLGGLVLLSLMM
jgi:hypothetical protein